MKNFHGYATLKTTGQLAMDLGSITTHIAALVSLLKKENINDSFHSQFFCWFLVGTIIFQALVAIGLYTFRLLDLEEEINHTLAKRMNIFFFVAVFIISILEAFIGIYEKFGYEGHQLPSNETLYHTTMNMNQPL